jgi:hypothetical protein
LNEPIAKPLVLQFNEVVKLRQNVAGRDFGADSEMDGVAENMGFEIASNGGFLCELVLQAIMPVMNLKSA